MGSISLNQQYIYNVVEVEPPYFVEVVRYDDSIIEYHAKVDTTNVTTKNLDGQIHVKNTNSGELKVNEIWVNGVSLGKALTYNKYGEFTSTILKTSIIHGASWNITLDYKYTGDPKIELIWGTTSSRTQVELGLEAELLNEFHIFNVSARGGVRVYTDLDSNDNYVDQTTGSVSLAMHERGANLWCGLNSGSCQGVATNNPTATLTVDTPAVSCVQYTADETINFFGKNQNQTYCLWTGERSFDVWGGNNDSALYSASHHLDYTATDNYALSSVDKETFPDANTFIHNVTDRWFFWEDVSESRALSILWTYTNQTGLAVPTRYFISDGTAGGGGDKQVGITQFGGRILAQYHYYERIATMTEDVNTFTVESQRRYDIYSETAPVVNQGTCQLGYDDISAYGDVHTCTESSNDVSISHTYAETPDRSKYILTYPNTTQELYIYNDTLDVNGLWLYLVFDGVWNYGSITPQGITPSGFSTNATLDAGVFNDTGVNQTSAPDELRFYYAHPSYTGTFDILFTDTELPLGETDEPDFQGITVDPLTPVNYTPGATYQFNVTWNDTSGIDTVLIEHNFTGSLVNETVTNNISDTYQHIVNDLPASTYLWRQIANDTLGNVNSTPQQTYTVNRIDAVITLLVSPSSSVTVGTNTTVTGNESNIGDGDVTYQLFRDGLLVDSIVNGNTVQDLALPVGTHTYFTNNTLGQNYTTGSDTLVITVSSASAPQLSGFGGVAVGILSLMAIGSLLFVLTNMNITKMSDIITVLVTIILAVGFVAVLSGL